MAAALLGGAHTAVTGLWLAGSTLLLDTVGGEIEQWGRERSATALAVLAAVFIVKLAVTCSGILFAGIGTSRFPDALFRFADGRAGRFLGWVAAGALITYGGVLTTVGLLVQAGLVKAAADADEHALWWHTFVWDPWFLAWGLALAATLYLSRKSGSLPGLRRGGVADGDPIRRRH